MALRHLSILLLALATPIVAGGQPDAAVWRFITPHATAVISIDWGRIRQSQPGAMLRDTLLNAGSVPAIPGMELINDIDRVVISSPGADPSSDARETPLLIAIRGHFNAVKVREFFSHFKAAPQSYNSFQVYRPQGKNAKDMAWVSFDAETILFGDAPLVFDVLNRNQFASPPAETASLVARAVELDANYDVWAIINAAEVLSNDHLAALFHGKDWASEAQGFEAGLHFGNGLTADIFLRFPTEATAQRVTAELARVTNLAAKDKDAGAPMQDIGRKLKFSSEGSSTKISLRLTSRELERSTQTFTAVHKAPPPVSGPAMPLPGPRVIRIEGLDEGTREIPYPELQH